jgi:hypothetical protein
MALRKSSGAAALPPGAENLARFLEWRTLPTRAAADGGAVLLTAEKWGDQGSAVAMWIMSSGAAPTALRVTNDNGRCWWNWATAGAAASRIAVFRLPGLAITPHGWGDTFPAIAGTPGFNQGRAPSITISSWVRKVAAGDATDARRGFGFGNSETTTPSATIPRCGLFGDGLLGFRFGSLHCPDGLAAGETSPNAIDANSVQPAELVNPGATMFHAAIKLLPPGPGQPGAWIAFLNGRAVKRFDLLANLPRGSLALLDATRNFNSVEPTMYGHADGVAAIAGYLTWGMRVRIADEWSATLY